MNCKSCRWLEPAENGLYWCEDHECYLSLDVVNKSVTMCKDYSKSGSTGILNKKEKK